MITRYVRNPNDGVASFDKIKLYKSSSKGGSYTLLSTTDIDQTTAEDNFYGATKIVDSVGTSASWYKWTYFNSLSTLESNYSEEMQAEITEFDMKLRRRMKDDNNNNYFFQDGEIIDARETAMKTLYPATWIDTSYDVLITDSNKKVISLPSYIKRPDRIKVYTSGGNFTGDYVAFYKVGNKAYALGEFPVGYTFRIIVTKPYKNIYETPDEFEPYLLDCSQIELCKSLEMDRARYYKYTTSIRPEGGNMPSLSKIIERLEVTVRARKNEIRRTREVTEINLI
jgi:hypothetical protein